jgi:hypothetical protein
MSTRGLSILLVLVSTTACFHMPSRHSLTLNPSIATPQVVDNLSRLYGWAQIGSNEEFAYCVFGLAQNDTPRMNNVEIAFIDSAKATTVTYRPRSCHRPGILGIGHSHPPGGVCTFSSLDYRTFRQSPYRFSFLVCGTGRILRGGRREITIVYYSRPEEDIPKRSNFIPLAVGSLTYDGEEEETLAQSGVWP